MKVVDNHVHWIVHFIILGFILLRVGMLLSMWVNFIIERALCTIDIIVTMLYSVIL
jgi:hypothetical protein